MPLWLVVAAVLLTGALTCLAYGEIRWRTTKLYGGMESMAGICCVLVFFGILIGHFL